MNRISLLALVAAATSASAATIYIDSFAVTQSVQTTGAKNVAATNTTSSYDGSIFGGYRTLSLTANKNGTLAAPSSTLTASNGYLTLWSAQSTSGEMDVTWGGANTDIDITSISGATGGIAGKLSDISITFKFIAANKGASIDWTFTDATGKVATYKPSTYSNSAANILQSSALSNFSAESGFDWTSIASLKLHDSAGGGYGISYGSFTLTSATNPTTPAAPVTIDPNAPTNPQISGNGLVPEPSTYGIVLGGLALVGAVIRRRKQAK